MEFRILGPLEVLEDGRPLSLGGRKQRALLALLLLHRNEVVSSDRLIDELWGESPPETVQTMLQVYVSRLRKLIAAKRLLTRSPGYLLRIEPDELDLERFERLGAEGREALAAGEAVSASEKLTEALSLWRGTALAELAYEPFAQREIARLEEACLVCLEERIEADLALARHGELVGELEALVSKHSLRERLRGQLMLALYRSGRQAEALAAYQEARRALVEELGIDPSPALQKLEKAILNQDPSLELAARAEARAEPTRGVFVGREAELGQLLAALEDALAGRGRLCLISGEPGIGKSRLADELITRARARGARILIGRCWEAGGAPAYWPWVQSLRSYIREADPEVLQAQLGAGAAEIAQILPELRDILPGLPEPASLDSEGARFRRFDATAEFFRNASKSQPILLVLDDLHAADAPSLLLLQFLARELGSTRILLLGALRDVDPIPGLPLTSMLAEVVREPVTRRLSLSGLSERDVAQYVELTASEIASPELVGALHEETEGNPLFVTETVRLLTLEGLRPEATGVRIAIPQSIRDVIARRLTHLSEECNRVLVLASVLGREFALAALARVSGVSENELLDMLDEAMAARVVTEVPGVHGRLRFSHALVRETRYEELTAVRRVQLHRAVGGALEELYAKDPEPHLAELAYHFFEALPGGDPRRAVDYARRAGDRAVRLLAYEEAVRLYRIALEGLVFSEVRDGESHCQLLLALGDAQTRAGDGVGAKETFLEAATLAKIIQTPELLAYAALGYGGRFVWARAGTDRQLVLLLEEALAALSEADSTLRVRVMARLAGALRDQSDREPGARLSSEAVDSARRLGDPGTLAYALDGRCMAIFWPENPEERIELATEMVRLAEEAGDVERVMQARYYRDVMFRLELGDLPTVRAELEMLEHLSEELKQPAHIWLVVATRATLALFEGRFDVGEKLAEDALVLGQRAQSSDALLSYRIHRFTLGIERAESDGLEELLAQSIQEYPARPMLRCMLVQLYSELGQEPEARTAFEELAAGSFAALPRTNEWLFSMGFLAEAAALLGDALRAGTMYELLLPYAARNASTADYISTGSVSRQLGLLAAMVGHWKDAERHFEDALEMNARIGARPWLARTQHDYARMLLARDEPGDREKAGELLASALATAQELGMVALEQKVAALVAKAKARLTPR